MNLIKSNSRPFLALLLVAASAACAEHRGDLQSQITKVAETATIATVPINYWVDFSDPKGQAIPATGVVGTGFLIDDQGDFITAAHVANIKEISTPDGPIKVRLTAAIKQKKAGSAGMAFDVVEADTDHDLALCHIPNFHVSTIKKSPLAKVQLATGEGALSRDEMSRPFASLAIAQRAQAVGDMVLVSGFPLGSWTPAIQLGLLSATSTRYPSQVQGFGVPKDTYELLQISVNANHGNSGGPVIDLNSGEVIGVIIQLVPAPLQLQGHQIMDSGSFASSGIMLAAPASWVESLLERHQVKSHLTKAGPLVVW